MSTRPVSVPRYTLADYRRWRGDWQLIDGVAIAMTPSPFGPHERVVSRLSRWIGSQIEHSRCRCEVYTSLDWIVSDETVVQPDLMVACGEQPERHLERPPEVVVEVLSEATRAQDLVVTRAIHREQGVPHYGLVDADTRTVEHVTDHASRSLTTTDTLDLPLPGATCRIEIACGRLFD